VHEVAQGLVPSCRVVYVDNDPIVLAHARALLTSAPEGRTAYIQADLREPEQILSDPVTRATLDFSQPIALMLVAVLHFVPDSDGPRPIVDTLLGALPSGSYLAASHVTPEHDPVGVGGLVRTYQASGLPAQARAAREFAELAFRGLDMVDPGLVLVSEWRPDAGSERPLASEVNWYGAIGRKP
jgi:hypothetical protein